MMFLLGMLASVLIILYLVIGLFFMMMYHGGNPRWLYLWPVMLVYHHVKWKIHERKDSEM